MTITIGVYIWGTFYQIFDFRQESRCDIRQDTGNGPAFQRHYSKLLLLAETAEIHQPIDHSPRVPRKQWSIPSFRVMSITATVFVRATNFVMRRLQSVLKAAARLISNKRKVDNITHVLMDQLHWLPICQRIDFKIDLFLALLK